jgi:hypothetical protein
MWADGMPIRSSVRSRRRNHSPAATSDSENKVAMAMRAPGPK